MSGTIKLAYHLNDQVMTYISFADGYKAGGFNLARVTNPAAANPLAPVLNTSFPEETVDSYELGIKSTLADRTVRLNAAVFDQKYKDFQLNTYTGILFVVSSVPRVESKGVEVDTDWVTPLNGLELLGRCDLCAHGHHRIRQLTVLVRSESGRPDAAPLEQSPFLCAALVRGGVGHLSGAAPELVGAAYQRQREIQLGLQHRIRSRSTERSRGPMDC